MPPSTTYTLTERDRDVLSLYLEDDIIAAGPWARGPMSLPHRVVIRDQGKQFVVHTQVINDSGVSFDQGNYVPKSDADALSIAWAYFARRVRLHHNLKDVQI